MSGNSMVSTSVTRNDAETPYLRVFTRRFVKLNLGCVENLQHLYVDRCPSGPNDDDKGSELPATKGSTAIIVNVHGGHLPAIEPYGMKFVRIRYTFSAMRMCCLTYSRTPCQGHVVSLPIHDIFENGEASHHCRQICCLDLTSC
jgi:hypothetical protein